MKRSWSQARARWVKITRTEAMPRRPCEGGVSGMNLVIGMRERSGEERKWVVVLLTSIHLRFRCELEAIPLQQASNDCFTRTL